MIALIATTLAALSPAAPRYTTVFDHREPATSLSETAFTAKMIAAGATFVDEDQSRKIRSVTNAGELIRGVIQPVITTLDADIIIAATARSTPVPAGALLRGKLVRFEATIEAKLIAVDVAQVIDSILIRESGAGTTDEVARDAALRRAGESLAVRVLETIAAKDLRRRIELTVEALPNITAAEELARAISALPGILDVEVVHSSLELTKLAVILRDTAPATTRDLAPLLEQEAGVTVTSYTAKSIKARHAPLAQRTSKPIFMRNIQTTKDLFAARFHAYAKQGIGTLVVENEAPSKATRGLLRVTLEGVTSAPVEAEAPELAPKSAATIIIPFFAEPQRVRSTAPARLQLELSYDVGGRRYTERRAVPVQLLDRRALDWREPESAAAFVTPRASAVRALADAALSAIPAPLKTSPFARAAALFRALDGIEYQRDPAHPGRSEELDELQYPVETLRRRRGDCDDLAVLYASLAEAAGVRAMLILTPGHVLVGIDAEQPASSTDRVVLHRGRTWLPIETTLAGKSFSEAWARGTAALARSRAEMLEVRVAWNRYQPAELDDTLALAPQLPSFATLSAELTELERARAEELAAELRAVEARIERGRPSALDLNARALLLVASHRIDEARRALELAAQKHPRSFHLSNNLGNVHLLLGDVKAAPPSYARALEFAGRDVAARIRIHLNAAVAARVAGDPARFGEHIADSLELAEDETARKIITDFLESLDGEGSVRGAADGGELSERVFWLSPRDATAAK